MLVVNKPAGWSVARRESRSGKPAGVLLEQLKVSAGASLLPTHRVDDEVGGLVVFAKSKIALDFLSGQFQSKTAERIFRGIAVVASEAEAAEITSMPLMRDAAGGLPTEFEVNYALAPDQHVLGRMHVYRKKGGRPAFQKQVQAHLAAVGAPVLGDDDHGLPDVRLLLSCLKRGYKGRETERPLLDGLALLAAKLTLRHPDTREEIVFEIDPPKSFEIALKNLRKFARR
jgi:23S rRNA-/tRNA-specific pseudouridylate synthase